MKFRTFTALRHRNFRLFFLGQAVSLTGTWMHSTAQGWLVLKLTDSAFYLSFVNAMGYWPILFFSLISGVLADRVSKRNMLLLTQSLSMALALVMALLVSLDVVRVWHVAALAGLLGVVNTFDIPSRQSFIVEMVGKEDLMNGIALNSSLFHGARVIGPAVAGILIGLAGLSVCFYINSATYAAIIVALMMMRFDKPPARRQVRPVFRELAEGLAYVKGSRKVSYFIIMVAASSLFAIPYIALMPIFARDVLGVGATGLGILMGSAGAGALGGALTLASAGTVKRKGKTAFIASIVSTAALIAFSLSKTPALSYALLVVVGWGMITQLATVNTLIQTDVPDELRGRVMSLYVLVFLGLIPVGNLLIGAAANFIGTPAAVTFGASTCLLLILVLFFKNRDLLSY